MIRLWRSFSANACTCTTFCIALYFVFDIYLLFRLYLVTVYCYMYMQESVCCLLHPEMQGMSRMESPRFKECRTKRGLCFDRFKLLIKKVSKTKLDCKYMQNYDELCKDRGGLRQFFWVIRNRSFNALVLNACFWMFWDFLDISGTGCMRAIWMNWL